MIRGFKHNVLLTGVGEDVFKEPVYKVHDPLSDSPKVWTKSRLDRVWKADDETQFLGSQQHWVEGVLPIMSARYLMLAIYLSRGKKS